MAAGTIAKKIQDLVKALADAGVDLGEGIQAGWKNKKGALPPKAAPEGIMGPVNQGPGYGLGGFMGQHPFVSAGLGVGGLMGANAAMDLGGGVLDMMFGPDELEQLLARDPSALGDLPPEVLQQLLG